MWFHLLTLCLLWILLCIFLHWLLALHTVASLIPMVYLLTALCIFCYPFDYSGFQYCCVSTGFLQRLPLHFTFRFLINKNSLIVMYHWDAVYCQCRYFRRQSHNMTMISKKIFWSFYHFQDESSYSCYITFFVRIHLYSFQTFTICDWTFFGIWCIAAKWHWGLIVTDNIHQ